MLFPKHTISFFTAVFAPIGALIAGIVIFFYTVDQDAVRSRDQWDQNTRVARDMYLADCAKRGALLNECAGDWDRSITLRTIYREKVSADER